MPTPEHENVRAPLLAFGAPGEAEGWHVVDDAVMGGRSAGALERTAEGTLVFSGRVSLEQGGGFSSVRSGELRASLAGARALRLTCRGDGRRYKLRLYTRRVADGVAYQAPFETVPGEWIERRFEPRDFAPSWRGRPVLDAPPLELGEVLEVGVLISDRQAGPFRLELRSLEGLDR